ncbi:hypothetical protein KSP40_PGU007328 [Platanthera guangdongensis]|uniref:Uncharacterized protein n=1 Tax=Platanthera guangdongensis TaxID=2320717 RepID=A0ABR2N352_9ASPA
MQDHVIPISTPGVDYALNVSIYSVFSEFNRGTLQSNSSHHHHLVDGPNLPFFFGTTLPIAVAEGASSEGQFHGSFNGRLQSYLLYEDRSLLCSHGDCLRLRSHGDRPRQSNLCLSSWAKQISSLSFSQQQVENIFRTGLLVLDKILLTQGNPVRDFQVDLTYVLLGGRGFATQLFYSSWVKLGRLSSERKRLLSAVIKESNSENNTGVLEKNYSTREKNILVLGMNKEDLEKNT